MNFKDSPCFCLDLPVTDYEQALDLQRDIVEARKENRFNYDLVILLEHPPVFTLGRNGGLENLIVSQDFLDKQGIRLVQIERGGNITYHGPGQLVVYPVLDINAAHLGIRDYVSGLEDVMIKTAAQWGIKAAGDTKNRGVWIGTDKLGSIGVSITRGISFHGLALNVNIDLEPFSWINPCGLHNIGITSMKKELGKEIPIKQVREVMKQHISDFLKQKLVKADLNQIKESLNSASSHTAKPGWLKRKLPDAPEYEQVCSLIRKGGLHTVCQEAKCPNQFECFSKKTATFMIMGSKCTRNCRFCNIETGPDEMPDPQEPFKIAEAVEKMELHYVVITSVTRDDLPDGGAGYFARTISEIRKRIPEALIEVLIPDFQGDYEALKTVLDAKPNVLNHNIETVPGLYKIVRPQAVYKQSLELIKRVKEYSPDIPAKSGLMLGLGETDEQIYQTLEDLFNCGCSMLTMGQYLQPSKQHLCVKRFVRPEEFDSWKKTALKIGFAEVASGPFVRSSYHAKDMYNKKQ
ncbi:Lipoyl synthase (lipoate synthase) [Desulfonema limicola]|uniref:Multifunctional fusion protein n=1 Tax=Desulfonema limicola TaxID=45656 RepID=A0A975GF68_9BACT|nr:lipoyl synthase [Desulfonema limicola]QTA78870.1 Lipoyl synthase (lipoate synthase) [Desulfonema limicola]